MTSANHVRLAIKSNKESKAQFLIIAFSWILRRIEIKDLPKDNKFLIIEASASLQSKAQMKNFKLIKKKIRNLSLLLCPTY